ncbi:Oidioi.mRNA.OKI2018_I69.XSR.g16302.t1.cds [Oikopleura dioica]|uniref:Oidioi.mRNA.OKI2018_I69.XSR.g16302.t1.cds n=1 Tax=Oikopleura dioica TaxID=34765 RepID=A0ABN7SFM5_OIKDI|nr:Oidioi.mRNA.OKI2018_I69.XSR.g16302.t1.cds [Oikopleura dioica]
MEKILTSSTDLSDNTGRIINRLILELLEENGKSGRIYNDSEFTSKLKRAGQYCRDIAASAKKSEDKIEDSSSEDSSSEESSSESDSSDSGTHSEINFGRLAVDSTSEDDSSYEDDSSGSSEEETSSEEESSEEEEYTP